MSTLEWANIEKKNEMLNFIKVKNIWSLKDSEKKKTGQCTDSEKIFINHTAKKMTCYWIYKELLKLKKHKLCKLKWIQLENGK